MKVLVTALLALLLHLTLGWAYTVAAGVVGGLWAGRRAWVVGGLGVGIEWAGLVVYNAAVDARAVWAMAEAVGGILGNLSGAVPVGMTVLIGILLGGLGGAVGGGLRALVRARRPEAGGAEPRSLYQGTWH